MQPIETFPTGTSHRTFLKTCLILFSIAGKVVVLMGMITPDFKTVTNVGVATVMGNTEKRQIQTAIISVKILQEPITVDKLGARISIYQ